jgi:broad specificity phosphatase PhoE
MNLWQGSSDLSLLSEKGKAQAQRVREAIMHMKFEKCFASPISRAKTSAEIIWEGRDEPLIFLDTLREANLMVLEGMRNGKLLTFLPSFHELFSKQLVTHAKIQTIRFMIHLASWVVP